MIRETLMLKKMWSPAFQFVGSKDNIRKETTFEKLRLNMCGVYPIVVVATMSSGKSTLINTLIGTDLLPSRNRACTAKAIAVLDNCMKTQFDVHAINKEGNYIHIENATKKILNEYNKTNEICEMIVEGAMQGIKSSNKPVLLIDTPGINNGMDMSHGLVTGKVLDECSEGMILYVINAQQIGTNDDSAFLTYIAKKIQSNNKLKIVFAINKMDLIDPDKENPETLIDNCKQYIESKGIRNPILFPISAESALLFKKVLQKENLTEKETEDFIQYYRYFTRGGFVRKCSEGFLKREENEEKIEIDGEVYTRKQIQDVLKNTGIPFLEKEISEILSKKRKENKDMVNVQISYNPYTVKTNLQINGKEIDNGISPLTYINDKRLQEWIEPRDQGSWPGIFKALRTSTGESRIEIEFTGTFGDFEDMLYAKNKYGKDCFEEIKLVHVNKETAKNADPYNKMLKLKELYQQLQDGPVEEFKTPDIQKNFNVAVNSEFRIVIVAPMSSGKSTLINAIIGRDMLPAVNQATTAVITEIKDNDNMEDFIVNADDKYGNTVVKNEMATKKLITELNYKKDPNDSEKKEALIHLIQLEGPIPALPSDAFSTVFVDTPGGNNSQNDEHEAMMDEAINDENKSLILYVFNGAQLGTNDSNIILKKIANAMKNSTNGKLSRDRFLFVANRMDEFDVSEEPYEDVIKNTILPQLAANGITAPNLFLTSAQTAKLVRMATNGEEFSETEEENFDTLVKRFNRSNRILPKYASLPVSIKESLLEKEEDYRNKGIHAEAGSSAKEEYRRKTAEINSGIPAVELAIKEYLEKYAIAIKIKTVHDTFMKKVMERNMVDNCEAEWAKSKESFEAIKEEIKQKREECDHSEKQKEFKEKVDLIQLNTESIKDEQAEIYRRIDNLVNNTPETIKKDEADYILSKFRHTIADIGEEARVEMENAFNNGVRLTCQQIVEEYAEYIQELNDNGALNVGGYDMKQTETFQMFNLKKVDDLLKEQYKFKKNVLTGQETRKKKGALAGFARLFNIPWGWETIDVYTEQEFVRIKDLARDQITEIQHSFDKEVNEEIKATEKQVGDLKNLTKNKLKGLDEMIENLLEDIDNLLDSQEELEKKVAKNAEKAKWVNDFIKQVDDLLVV